MYAGLGLEFFAMVVNVYVYVNVNVPTPHRVVVPRPTPRSPPQLLPVSSGNVPYVPETFIEWEP
jgi:hypothetical protein